MKNFEIKSLEDATSIVCRYGLAHFACNGRGTAAGLANDLFGRGVDLNIWLLADLLRQYRQTCATEGTAQVDARLEKYANGVADTIATRTGERKALADFIDCSRQNAVEVSWDLVARMATAQDPERLLSGLTDAGLAELQGVLDALAEFELSFSDSIGLRYKPGRDSLQDAFLHTDILRFDESLRSARPWDCGEPDWYE